MQLRVVAGKSYKSCTVWSLGPTLVHHSITATHNRCSGHLTSSRRTRATSSAAHQNGQSAASMAACASAVQSACASPCASSSRTKRSHVSVRRTPWVAKRGGCGDPGQGTRAPRALCSGRGGNPERAAGLPGRWAVGWGAASQGALTVLARRRRGRAASLRRVPRAPHARGARPAWWRGVRRATARTPGPPPGPGPARAPPRRERPEARASRGRPRGTARRWAAACPRCRAGCRASPARRR